LLHKHLTKTHGMRIWVHLILAFNF
jgi:hypothetical protein